MQSLDYNAASLCTKLKIIDLAMVLWTLNKKFNFKFKLRLGVRSGLREALQQGG
jgi:hypothetical protein